MQRRSWGALVVLAIAVACASDTAGPTSTDVSAKGAVVSTGGTDTSGSTPSTPTQPSPEPTSDGPVASVDMTPQTLTISAGTYGHLAAIPRDADGVRVRGKIASWRSDDANSVVVGDTGVVYGKAVGSAKVYATIDGIVESALVTVTAAATPPTSPGTPSTPPTAPVSSFNLTATVVGALPGADTSRTEVVSGAVVRLLRSGGVAGDTLANPVDAGSATTNANGVVTFSALPGGWYTIEVTPPAGSPYAAVKTGIGAPTTAEVSATFRLRRK